MDKWVSVIAVVASAVLGLFIWLVQKNRERREEIKRRKQALYESLLISVTELHTANAAPLFVESQLAWLYASDDVLLLLHSLFVSIRDKKSEAELQQLLGKLLLEMRGDVLGKTAISDEWLKARYEAVTPPCECFEIP